MDSYNKERQGIIEILKYVIPVVFILLFCIFCFTGQKFLNDKVIGMTGHPGFIVYVFLLQHE